MPRQADPRYSFQPLVGNAQFEVVSFEVKEGISTPFKLELTLISVENAIRQPYRRAGPILNLSVSPSGQT